VNVTPLEPGWEGHVTLEFSNTTPLPAKIYADEGACQFLFLKGEGACEVSYARSRGQVSGAARGDVAAFIGGG
jgi:dCTP deaminase